MWTISKACARCISLQVPAVACSEDCSADGVQSVPSNSTSTAGRSLWHDRTTERWTLFQSGTTCVRLTEGPGRDTWTSSRGASPVTTSLRSADGPASVARSPDSGLRWPASSARSGRPGCSSRTPLISSSSDSTSSYRTLTRAGTMRNGVVSPRPSSAPPTSVTGFGYWGVPGKPLPEVKRKDLFAKIDAQDHQRWVLLPPKTFEFFPTPTYSDAKNYGSTSQLKRAYIPLSCRVRIVTDTGTGAVVFNNTRDGRTNPVWCEWLMGQPLKWNSLEPLEMRSFLSWLHAHSKILQRGLIAK